IEVLSGRVPGVDPPREEIRPLVTSVEPPQRDFASRGLVELRGLNLAGVSGVLFGSARGDLLERASDRLSVRLPAVSVPGIVPITLEYEGDDDRLLSAAGGTFKFSTPPPILTDLPLPRSAPASGGDVIVLRGENFTSPPDLRVLFGTVPAAIDVASRADRILVRAPRSPFYPLGGEVPIQVFTDQGRHSATVRFEYEAVTGGNGGEEEDPAATVLGLVTTEASDLGGSPFIARSPILDGATMRICGK